LQTSGEESFNLPVEGSWKPLVLVVPLRLGLSEINPVYVQGLKVGGILTSLLLKTES
jgi:cysteine protease ATG4